MSSQRKPIPSCPGFFADPVGRIYRGSEEVFQSSHFKREGLVSGYKTVWVLGKHRKVHRLVCEAYLSNPEQKPHVNHIDGNKGNNSLNNLEWATARENNSHARKLGLSKSRSHSIPYRSNLRSISKRGLKNPRCRLSTEDIEGILKDHASGVASNRHICSKYGISESYLGQLVRGDRRQETRRQMCRHQQ